MFSDTKDLRYRLGQLEGINEMLGKQLDTAQARIKELEDDNRELRNNLLIRIGLLPRQNTDQAQSGDGLKPVRKATAPWATQAARLEADSKDRYWRAKIKEIEDRDKAAQPEPQTDEEKDLAELSK